MELAAKTTFRRPTLASASAFTGGVLWVAAPRLPIDPPLAPGSIEHVFLLMPLVVVPLALALVADLQDEDDGDPSPVFRLARRLQPCAAALLLLSFSLPTGTGAGLLALPWLGMALLLAASTISRIARGGRARSDSASLAAAQVFLAIGAVWLLLWRMGTGPRHLSPLLVSLAALHFHFNGFSAQVLIGATGRRVRGSTRLRVVHRTVTVAAIGGLPLLALGKALAFPVAQIAGAGATTLALLGLSLTMMAVARAERSAATRALLIVCAASGAAGAGLAFAFGAGEFVRREWISLGAMLGAHGALMIAFVLCGIAGQLRQQRDSAAPLPARRAVAADAGAGRRVP